MKLAIIGATGHVGTFLLKEATARGIDVTAIVRSPNKLSIDVPYLQKDLFDLTREDLTGFDVVIDAFNAPRGKEELHQTSLTHLIQLLSGTSVRLLVVGGASSLYVTDTKRMIDLSDPQAAFYPTAKSMYLALIELKDSPKLDWTYLSPAAYFNSLGKRTGTYQESDDRLMENSDGESEISMADYAIAMIDEVVQPKHIRTHYSVVSK